MMSEEGMGVNPFGSGGNLQLELTEPRPGTGSQGSPSPGQRRGSGGAHSSPGAGGEVGVLGGGGGGLMCVRGGGMEALRVGELGGELGGKLEWWKNWSVSTYKVTRQAIEERLGKAARTVDVEVEAEVEGLRQLRADYQDLLVQARALAGHFGGVLGTQRALADSFRKLSVGEEPLRDDLLRNAQAQAVLADKGDSLLAALNAFASALTTLTDKSIDDTLATVKAFETARLEYDAYRGDLAALQGSGGSGGQGGLDAGHRLRDAEAACADHKRRYEALRQDVQVKMKFLAEHRSKAMTKHLLLFHNATAAYFSGNAAALDAALKQFALPNPNAHPPSFLQE